MGTRYQAGAAFERALRKELRKYDCVGYVMRSAGSRGKVDILALRKSRDYCDRDAALFQCKTGGVIAVSERLELGRIAGDTKMTAAIVSRGSRSRFAVYPIDKFGTLICEEPLSLDLFLRSYLGWTDGHDTRTD